MRATLVIALGALVLASVAGAKTIVGTDRADVLVGTPSADALFGRGGADHIFGGGGPDFLSGGPGHDLLSGGPGDDRISAEYDGARDSVICGPGFDVVTADQLDTVASDCELVSRRISRDPYLNPESQHETEVEPSSATADGTTVAVFQVGRRSDGGATNIGFSTSRDGGRSWRGGLVPGLTKAGGQGATADRASDPVVAYDATNGVWLAAALVLDASLTRLDVSRSSDGASWGAPVVAAEQVPAQDAAYDKEWIACDNAAMSARRGTCYLAYTHTPAGGTLAVQSTTDGGLTWSQPTELPVTGVVGALPEILPSGTLVVVYLWGDTHVGASISTDGGASFSAPTLVSDVQARPVRGLRFFPLPSASVDPSGKIWVTWHDCRLRPGCSTNDVVVVTSPDGVTWTAPKAVTSGRNAFLPAIGIERTTGRVAIAYYTLRPTGIGAELVQLTPGGTRFGAPRRVTTQSMASDWLPDTVSGRMLADYISVTWAGARPLVVWALASPPVGASFRQAIYATRG